MGLGPKESIIACIFDGWDHTSQNEQAACTHDYDLSQITKRLDGNDVAFMNASMSIRENTWYKVAAKMSENETTAEII